MKRYGIRVIHESWATIDGGLDLVGTLEEIETLRQRWQADSDQKTRFVLDAYDGDDPADRAAVAEFLARDL